VFDLGYFVASIDALMDELHMYSVALSAGQVTTLYNSYFDAGTITLGAWEQDVPPVPPEPVEPVMTNASFWGETEYKVGGKVDGRKVGGIGQGSLPGRTNGPIGQPSLPGRSNGPIGQTYGGRGR